jgi:hypothetical protein
MTHWLFQYVVHRPLPQLWFRSDLRTDLRCPGPLRYRHGIYPGSGFRERPRDLLKFMVLPATCAEGVRYRLPRRYRHLLLPFSPHRLVCTVLDCWGQYPRSRCCRVISGGAVAGFIGRYIGRHPMLYPSCRAFIPLWVPRFVRLGCIDRAAVASSRSPATMTPNTPVPPMLLVSVRLDIYV